MAASLAITSVSVFSLVLVYDNCTDHNDLGIYTHHSHTYSHTHSSSTLTQLIMTHTHSHSHLHPHPLHFYPTYQQTRLLASDRIWFHLERRLTRRRSRHSRHSHHISSPRGRINWQRFYWVEIWDFFLTHSLPWNKWLNLWTTWLIGNLRECNKFSFNFLLKNNFFKFINNYSITNYSRAPANNKESFQFRSMWSVEQPIKI